MPTKAKVVSVAFALCGFAVAVVSGLGAGNAPYIVLLRALVTMIACQILGMIIGTMLERVIEEHEAMYKEKNPVSVVPSMTGAPGEVVVVDEVVDESGTSGAPA